MIFCQGCGAKNADQARFCNMCGGRIAVVGEPGGPVEEPLAAEASGSLPSVPEGAWASGPAASRGGMPPMGDATTGITLARIGVQSPRRVWSALALVAVGLVALGALSTWLVTGRDGDGAAEGGHAQADDPFVIGTPLPRGAETPDEAFLGDKPEGAAADLPERNGPAPEAQQPSRRAAPAPARPQRGASGVAQAAPTAPAPTQPEAPPSTGEAGPSATDAPRAAAGETAAADEDDAKGAPGEGDIAMDLYGARVRYAVQRYYATRAQGCFDRATRNQPSLSGTVVVGLRIGADGRVKQGSVARNTTGDAELGACLAGQVRGWQLPPPPDGAVDMEMPFSR